MAEGVDPGSLPQAAVVPRRRMPISAVWIIPILTAVVAIGVAIQRFLSEGPTVTILFKSADGVEAGKTFIKYKEVNIGQVTAVGLSQDYSGVVVTAKIAKSAEGLMVDDARFWVVKPRITLSGISGLSTLLSGNYIGFEAGRSAKRVRQFTGLAVPPPVTSGDPGRQYVLKAENLGSLSVGSPLYYRRLAVGQVIGYDLAADGKSVDIKVFVNAPYDRYVKAGTRFWNVSGLDVSVGANGVSVQTESLVALLAGGVAFDTPQSSAGGEAASPNAAFTLYNNRSTALTNFGAPQVRYLLEFKESVRGLSVGAPVTFLGLPIGEVTDVGLAFDPKTLDVRTRVSIAHYPDRLKGRVYDGSTRQLADTTLNEIHAVLRGLVERGLRAQLRSGNLLTGQLYVAFDYFPDAPKAAVDWSKQPVELPSVPSNLEDLEAKVTRILDKLDHLPLEQIGKDAKNALATLDRTLQAADQLVRRVDGEIVPEVKNSLAGLRGTLANAERVLKSADNTLVGQNAPAQQELRNAMQEVARAARAVRVLADYLERHPEALIRGKSEEKRK